MNFKNIHTCIFFSDKILLVTGHGLTLDKATSVATLEPEYFIKGSIISIYIFFNVFCIKSENNGIAK